MLSRAAVRVAVVALLVAFAMPQLASFNSFTPIKALHSALTAYYQRFGVPVGRNITAESAALEAILRVLRVRTDTDEHFLHDVRLVSTSSSPVQLQPPRESEAEMVEARLPTKGSAVAYWITDEKVRKSARMMKTLILASDAPVLLYLHGGGFSVFDVEAHRAFLVGVSRHAFIRVLAVEYRLIPDHPLTTCVADAVEWYEHLISVGVSSSTIFVAGDSAGGFLALAVGLHARDRKVPRPAALMLLTPWLDLSLSGSTANSNDPHLSPDFMRRFASIVAPFRTSVPDPMTVNLRDLPPVYISGAGQDPLFDDARRFVPRLKEAGLQVNYQYEAEAFHDWFKFWFLTPEALLEVQRIGMYVKSHLIAYYTVNR